MIHPVSPEGSLPPDTTTGLPLPEYAGAFVSAMHENRYRRVLRRSEPARALAVVHAPWSDARVSDLLKRIQAGDRAAVARACRILDERARGFEELSRALFACGGATRTVGITGAPGAGKSTLTDGLIAELRARGERVGVLAVDPTSPFSGGALLGDRIRMERHVLDDAVFVRSLATRGAQGGLSASVFDMMRVLAAWGATTVVVETVGVGQAELDVLGAADTIVVVLVPGMGDAIQANKAGILEIADVFALNKADGPGVEATEGDLELAIALGNPEPKPPVVRTVAPRHEGVPALLRAIDSHGAWLSSTPEGVARRRQRERAHAIRLVSALLTEAVLARLDEQLSTLVDADVEPHAARDALLAELSLKSR